MRDLRVLGAASAAVALAGLSAAVAAAPARAQGGDATPPLTVESARQELDNKRGRKADLPGRLRQWFGAENLKRGPNAKVSDTVVVWAIEVSDAEKGKETRVVSEDGEFALPLRRVEESNIYAAVLALPDGAALRWAYEVNGERRGDWRNLEVYLTAAESKAQAGVPKGTVTQMPPWKSQVFAGTTRDWWVYVPAQYTPDKPACVMVFQDGGGPKNDVPAVFDNLIAKGEMPVTVGIFINPGRFEDGRSNRSVEYDTLSDRYARFLLEEILPEVEKTTKLRHDPAARAISGISSGGICAFTVAWEKPDQFSKVLSGVGSFVNLQGGQTGIGGGHNYPVLVRKSKGSPKPIRVYLSDGSNDLDNPFGNWPLANWGMVRAMDYAGYDYKFVYGQGFHGGRFGQVLMPESLRWLWRDEAPTPAPVR